MHLDQLPDADLGINRSRFQAGVAEELLDVADVGPSLFSTDLRS